MSAVIEGDSTYRKLFTNLDASENWRFSFPKNNFLIDHSARSYRSAVSRKNIHFTLSNESGKRTSILVIFNSSGNENHYIPYLPGNTKFEYYGHLSLGPSIWDKLRAKVKSFSKLIKGWDSYDAEPPSKESISNTLLFLNLVEKHSLIPDWVEPTSDDSIMLEIKVGETIQEWDFYSDGEIAVLRETIEGQSVAQMVEPTKCEMSKILKLDVFH